MSSRFFARSPSYQPDPCRWTRYGVLLGLNKWEADMVVRVFMSIIMGSIIGFERCSLDFEDNIKYVVHRSSQEVGVCLRTLRLTRSTPLAAGVELTDLLAFGRWRSFALDHACSPSTPCPHSWMARWDGTRRASVLPFLQVRV